MNDRLDHLSGRILRTHPGRIILSIFLSSVLIGSVFVLTGFQSTAQKNAYGVGLITGTGDTFKGTNGKIAFVSNRAGFDPDIYVMNDNGFLQTRVTINSLHFNSAPIITDAPVWSPDGNKLLFVALHGYSSNIWVVNTDGTNQTNLTKSPENITAYNTSPQWSPDGSKIIFLGNLSCWLSGEIYTMNPDGSAQTNISHSNVTAGQCDTDPHWSPDGTKILFDRVLRTYCPDPSTCNPELNNQTIYTMKPDGSNQTNVSQNDGSYNDENPRWSPDGNKIVFDTNRGGEYQVYVMNSNGTGQTNISNDLNANDTSPLWSPDGTKILFKRFTAQSGIPEHCLMLMGPDGSNQMPLACTQADPNVGDPMAYVDTVYAWSPDGTMIALGGPHHPACNQCDNFGSIGVITRNGTLVGSTYNGRTLDILPSWGVKAGTTPPPPPSDTTPPNTIITSASDGSNVAIKNNTKTTSTTIHVYFDGIDNVGVVGFECRLDGTIWNSCTNSVTYTGLSMTKHEVDIRAVDGAGNKDPTPAIFKWTVAKK